jgi:hypothetical protein
MFYKKTSLPIKSVLLICMYLLVKFILLCAIYNIVYSKSLNKMMNLYICSNYSLLPPRT